MRELIEDGMESSEALGALNEKVKEEWRKEEEKLVKICTGSQFPKKLQLTPKMEFLIKNVYPLHDCCPEEPIVSLS